MRVVALVTVLAIGGCPADKAPSSSSSTTPPVTGTASTPSTTSTPSATSGPTTATGCLAPNPVYVDCRSERRHDILGYPLLASVGEYDSCGRLAFETGYDLDGEADSQTVRTYFADSRPDTQETDYAPFDGVPDLVLRSHYDNQGRAAQTDFEFAGGSCVLRFVYVDGDELFDETTFSCTTGGSDYTDVYTSDPALPTEHRWTLRVRDYGSDGSFEETESFAWDAVASQRTSVVDSTHYDYEQSLTKVLQYDASGLWDWEEHDRGHTGTVDYRTDWSWDTEGRVTGWVGTDYQYGGTTNSWLDWDCPSTTTGTPQRAPMGPLIDPTAPPEALAEQVVELTRRAAINR